MELNPHLIALIEAMNDQPIAFNKHYVFIGCGINGALMLSQLVYWSSRTRDKDGWIYKDHNDWTSETGLTRKEQHTARKVLKGLGFISEKKKGVPPIVYFRVEREKLYTALIAYSQKISESQLCHTAQLNVPYGTIECAQRNNRMCHTAQSNVPKGARISENTTENTTENTKDHKQAILVKNKKEKSSPQKPISTLTDAQIHLFSAKLARNDEFGSVFANVGETTEDFAKRIRTLLEDEIFVSRHMSYLVDVGFKPKSGT